MDANIIMTTPPEIFNKKPPITSHVTVCVDCRKTGTDMHAHLEYVGGQGDVEVYLCDNCFEKTWNESLAACEALRKAMAAK